jgi:hypothetical protein
MVLCGIAAASVPFQKYLENEQAVPDEALKGFPGK